MVQLVMFSRNNTRRGLERRETERGTRAGRRAGRQELSNSTRLNGRNSPGIARMIFGTGRAHRLPRP